MVTASTAAVPALGRAASAQATSRGVSASASSDPVSFVLEINARQQLNAMILGPNDVVYMNAGECETTDKVMQSVAGRPWELWKSKVMAK